MILYFYCPQAYNCISFIYCRFVLVVLRTLEWIFLWLIYFSTFNHLWEILSYYFWRFLHIYIYRFGSEKAFENLIEMEYIDWIFYIYWKCMLECGGKWDIVSDFFFFMYKYWNLIENKIERLISLMKTHVNSNEVWYDEWKNKRNEILMLCMC